MDSRSDPRGMNAPGGVPTVAMVLPAAGIGWPNTMLLTGVGDVVLMLESPKISAFRDEMKRNISGALDTDEDAVGLKATTTDGLGAIGRGEGAACMAVALVERIDD